MKKLLFTIIILGACLVGSSQNWDSVKVGNVDVDSIMLGGAKIWEKPNADTITWTYEGVMTVGEVPLQEGVGYGLAGVPGDLVGEVSPSFDLIFQAMALFFNAPESRIEFYAYNEGYSFTVDDIHLSISGVEYTLSFVEMLGHTVSVASNPFPPVGQTCEIKLRYTLAP